MVPVWQLLRISQGPLQESGSVHTFIAMSTDEAKTDDHRHDPQSIDWEEMYQGDDRRWSGHVNGSLVAEVGGLPAGRALDVGCGEGADAIWLAEQGWTVTAVDVAPTAVDRGAAEAAHRGVDIEWVAADLLTDPPNGQFELVSLHYPAFPIGLRGEVAAALAERVASGGLLLVVGHAPPEDPASIPFDPADWVQPDDLAHELQDGWIVETHETRPRPGEHHAGSPHSHDVVLRARKSLD